MARKRFNELEIVQIILLQGATFSCPWCREPIRLGEEIERDHLHEIALGGEDTPENCRYLHKNCHAEKTDGRPSTTLGSSKHEIAKTKRLERKRLGTERVKPKRKIQSRGFPKHLKKKFDGTVEKR